MKKNIIFLMIDTLRYDRLGISGYRPDLTPTLNWLARNGIHFTRMYAQAPSTQMVFPCIHSSTYPLDYNGYNDGMKDRPWSAAEVLKANGYQTYAYMGMPVGRYQYANRGFDQFYNFYDFRNLISQIIKRDFLHYYRLSDSNPAESENTFEILKSRAAAMFDALIQDYETNEPQFHYPFVKRRNRRYMERLKRERDLFNKDPEATLRKIKTLGPDHFINFLGVSKVPRLRLLWYRALNFCFYTTSSLLRKTIGFWSLRRSHADAEVLNHNTQQLLTGEVKPPFFIYVHYCDIHEGQKLHDRADVKRIFRGGRIFLKEASWRAYQGDYAYDFALGAVDRDIGKFLSFLKTSGWLKNSILVINGDHGDGRETSFPRRRPTLINRFHREFLHIPFTIYHEGVEPQVIEKLCGQADVFPTLFDLVGVESPKEFIGRSMLKDERKYVISEAADSGNCDLSRRVLSFTITDEKFKLIAHLKGDVLEPAAFYDLERDPWEMNNLVEDDRYRDAMDERQRIIYEERVKPIRAEHPFMGLVEA